MRSEAAAEDDGDDATSGVHPVPAAAPSVPVFDLVLPSVPGLEFVPRRIVEEDAEDLRWRFAEPTVASLSASSGMGASLERAESYGFGALPCRKCGGRWRRRLDSKGEEDFIEWRDGTGRMPRKQQLGPHCGDRPTYSQALARYRRAQVKELGMIVIPRQPGEEDHVRAETEKVFWNRGVMCVTPEVLAEMFPALPDDLTEPCASPKLGGCGGIGVVPRVSGRKAEVTVWPKGSSVRLGGREGLDADGLRAAIADSDRSLGAVHDAGAFVSLLALERYVLVERTLADVASLAPIARLALEELYRPYGGLHLLLNLTPAALEPESRRGAGNAWEARRQAQADELYDFAGKCWNLCSWGGAA